MGSITISSIIPRCYSAADDKLRRSNLSIIGKEKTDKYMEYLKFLDDKKEITGGLYIRIVGSMVREFKGEKRDDMDFCIAYKLGYNSFSHMKRWVGPREHITEMRRKVASQRQKERAKKVEKRWYTVAEFVTRTFVLNRECLDLVMNELKFYEVPHTGIMGIPEIKSYLIDFRKQRLNKLKLEKQFDIPHKFIYRMSMMLFVWFHREKIQSNLVVKFCKNIPIWYRIETYGAALQSKDEFVDDSASDTLIDDFDEEGLS